MTGLKYKWKATLILWRKMVLCLHSAQPFKDRQLVYASNRSSFLSMETYQYDH